MLDRETSDAIEALEPVKEEQACGRMAINGLLDLAQQRGLRAKTVDTGIGTLTCRDGDRVVGFGASFFG